MRLPFLTSKGLEQSSAEAVARQRAAHIATRAPDAWTLDATCGIGADSVALALTGGRVACADLDLEHLAFARANLLHHGCEAHVVQADATLPAVRADLLLLDPDRRADGRRTRAPARWSPNLETAVRLTRRFAGACLKLAPGLDVAALLEVERVALDPGEPRTREWVSREGELAELCLWVGALAHEDRAPRIATRIEADGRRSRLAGEVEEIEPLDLESARQARWLADPDPAVIRSGLLGRLARITGLAPLARQIAYLGGDQPPDHLFLRAFRVIDSAPLDHKRVRAMLTEHGIGPIAVRKRGHPDPAEVLEKRLRGRGKGRGSLIVARLEKGHRAYLVEQAPRAGSGGILVGDEGFEPPTSSL